MKRTAATFVVVAGLGGCATTDKPTPGAVPAFGQATLGKETPGLVGPSGSSVAVKPTTAAKVAVGPAAGVVPAGATTAADAPAAPGFAQVGGGCADGSCGDTGDGVGRRRVGHGHNGPGPDYGPMSHGLQDLSGHAPGIYPAPARGVDGAVALHPGVFAMGGGGAGPQYCDQRTQIRFVSPAGAKIAWLVPGGGFSDATPLEAPARYNFPQGAVYRLKMTGVPNRPGLSYYPTLEVYPTTPKTVTFLSHSYVPVGFTDDDFDQVRAGNLVVKVVYLPDAQFQDLAAAGAEEVVSTRLEPGVDPIVEANRRGTILAVIRLGAIDLQDPNTPAMGSPSGMAGPPGGMTPPGAMTAPGMTPAMPAPTPPAVPVPPATPAPATPGPLPGAMRGGAPGMPVSLPALK